MAFTADIDRLERWSFSILNEYQYWSGNELNGRTVFVHFDKNSNVDYMEVCK